MALGLIGKKVGMTQVFDENGFVVPVTVIEAGPCLVVQRKTSGLTDRVRKVKMRDGSLLEVKVKKTDGYDSVKLGFLDKTRNVTKPEVGQFPQGAVKKYLKEFRLAPDDSIAVGSTLTVELFKEGDMVDISGMSKGRGFQGVIKRHGFAGGPATHGTQFKRAPGSIGQCAWPSKVFKGKKLPGHYGDVKVTVQNLRVIGIDQEKNLLLVKGSVPGSRNGILCINKAVKKGNQS